MQRILLRSWRRLFPTLALRQLRRFVSGKGVLSAHSADTLYTIISRMNSGAISVVCVLSLAWTNLYVGGPSYDISVLCSPPSVPWMLAV